MSYTSFLAIIWRQIKRFRNAVDLAIVAIQLIELDSLRLVDINIIKH